MPTADELREAISTNREKLRDVLAAAAATWESGDDGGWTPRAASEHCIERDAGLAGIIAAALSGEPLAEEHARTNNPEEPVRLSLANASAATAALEASGRASDAAVHDVTDADLSRPAELFAGPLPKTIEGAMTLAAWHLNDHAEQIAKMS